MAFYETGSGVGKGREQGFSLIELMVVVAVTATLATLAAPSFSTFIASQRVKSVAYDLVSGLLLARSEALKRNQDVVVVPTTASEGWGGGWQVVANKVGGGTDTISTQTAISGITFGSALFVAPTSIVYSGSSGRPATVSKFQLTGGTTLKCVKVDISGVITSVPGVCT